MSICGGNSGTIADLSVREQVVVDKVRDTELTCTTVGIRDANALCLDSAVAGCCRHARDLDRHHNRRRDEIRVHEQQVLHGRQVTGRCLQRYE